MTSSRSSGLKSSSGIIQTGRNRINAVTLITDGTNAATLTVYDNASAGSGLVISKVTASGAQNTTHVIYESPVVAENGIYATVTGTGASYIIFYGG